MTQDLDNRRPLKVRDAAFAHDMARRLAAAGYCVVLPNL